MSFIVAITDYVFLFGARAALLALKASSCVRSSANREEELSHLLRTQTPFELLAEIRRA